MFHRWLINDQVSERWAADELRNLLGTCLRRINLERAEQNRGAERGGQSNREGEAQATHPVPREEEDSGEGFPGRRGPTMSL